MAAALRLRLTVRASCATRPAPRGLAASASPPRGLARAEGAQLRPTRALRMLAPSPSRQGRALRGRLAPRRGAAAGGASAATEAAADAAGAQSASPAQPAQPASSPSPHAAAPPRGWLARRLLGPYASFADLRRDVRLVMEAYRGRYDGRSIEAAHEVITRYYTKKAEWTAAAKKAGCKVPPILNLFAEPFVAPVIITGAAPTDAGGEGEAGDPAAAASATPPEGAAADGTPSAEGAAGAAATGQEEAAAPKAAASDEGASPEAALATAEAQPSAVASEEGALPPFSVLAVLEPPRNPVQDAVGRLAVFFCRLPGMLPLVRAHERLMEPLREFWHRMAKNFVETLEELDDSRERSQLPGAERLRERRERVTKQKLLREAYFAMAERLEDFRLDRFLHEMQVYFLPIFLHAYLKPEVDLLAMMSAEEIVRQCESTAKERRGRDQKWEWRLINVGSVDITGCKVNDDGFPVFTISFAVEVMTRVRSVKTGQVIDSGDGKMRTMNFTLSLLPESVLPEFEWRVVEVVSGVVRVTG